MQKRHALSKTLFLKIKGYDELLTGPEDLDLHKRLMPLTSLGRASGIIIMMTI